MSHYELSKIVAHLLGYQIDQFSQQPQGYYVNGEALNGAAGFDQIIFNKDGNLTSHLH